MSWASILKRKYDNESREYQENFFKILDDFTRDADYMGKSYSERMKNIIDEMNTIREMVEKRDDAKKVETRFDNMEMLMQDFEEEFKSISKKFNAIKKLIKMG